MPHIELRTNKGTSGPGDIRLSVQEKTHEYLRSTDAKSVRVSAYLDEDLPRVERHYEELFVEGSPNVYLVTEVIPGSKTRKKISLPAGMNAGEQLTVLVAREGAETDAAPS